MMRITCFNDLEPHGIIALTGESCGLMYRVLFDVTERGRAIVGRWLGVPDLRLGESWNRGSADDPHVGSLLLSHECLVPLGVFCLLHAGCTEVWLLDRAVVGIEAADDPGAIGRMREFTPPLRVLRPEGTAGDRNVRCMSGRIA